MMRSRGLLTLMLALVMMCTAVHAAAEFSFGFLPARTYDGKRYEARPSSELTTILLIGYDHDLEGEMSELHGYSNGGQADFLLLLVLDHRDKQVHMLQIDRDTMTNVTVTDQHGRQHDRSSLQICLAHAYGSTREENNANTVRAVEKLIGIDAPDDGAQIDWYVSMDISGISRLNDLLGGVTLTFETDMTDVDPAMTEGATLTLTGHQAERFCRGRYGVGDQTNASRMIRQRQYMSAAGRQLAAMVHEDLNAGARLLDGMGVLYDETVASDGVFDFSEATSGNPSGEMQNHYLMTNAMRRTIVKEVGRAAGYEILEAEFLPGAHSMGSNGYVRFDVEGDAALVWSLNVLYDTDNSFESQEDIWLLKN